MMHIISTVDWSGYIPENYSYSSDRYIADLLPIRGNLALVFSNGILRIDGNAIIIDSLGLINGINKCNILKDSEQVIKFHFNDVVELYFSPKNKNGVRVFSIYRYIDGFLFEDILLDDLKKIRRQLIEIYVPELKEKAPKLTDLFIKSII